MKESIMKPKSCPHRVVADAVSDFTAFFVAITLTQPNGLSLTAKAIEETAEKLVGKSIRMCQGSGCAMWEEWERYVFVDIEMPKQELLTTYTHPDDEDKPDEDKVWIFSSVDFTSDELDNGYGLVRFKSLRPTGHGDCGYKTKELECNGQ